MARTHLSIGEVLSLLRDEFADVTISKIRFLESQGLVDPERTPSGYRKFYDHDVERLRWILRQQRENFLPLKVIRDRLEDTAEPDAPGPLDADAATDERTDVTGGPVRLDLGADQPAAAVATRGAAAPAPGRPGGVPGTPAPVRSQLAAAAFAAVRAGLAAVPDTAAPAPTPSGTPPAATTPTDTSRVDTSRVDPAPAEPAPADTAPADTAPADPASGDPAPADPASGDPASGDTAPGVALIVDATPVDTQPADTAPVDATPTAGAAPPEAPVRATSPAAGPARPPEPPAPAEQAAAPAPADDLDSYTVAELARAAGVTESDVAALREFGLIAPDGGIGGTAYYGPDALEVVRAATVFAGYGVEARHLRAWKTGAEREAALIEAVITPLLRQRNPQARRQAADTVAALVEAGARLRALLVQRAVDGFR